MANTEFLDNYEKTLEEGLIKICRSAGMLREGEVLLSSPDIDEVWNERYIKDYVADAAANFGGYPEVAIAWAGFLGFGVAKRWDEDWAFHCKDAYRKYYGPHGYDDMDEYILKEILGLEIPGSGSGNTIAEGVAKKISDLLSSCATAALGLLRRCGVEPDTADEFYALVRTYTVLYRLGAAMELTRLGYHNVKVNPSDLKN
ncbi:MAG: hypothetical protein MJY56_04680 [Bacteroidales bacterium]|nr:hypothetical protein [Bacteroidales bacterium]